PRWSGATRLGHPIQGGARERGLRPKNKPRLRRLCLGVVHATDPRSASCADRRSCRQGSMGSHFSAERSRGDTIAVSALVIGGSSGRRAGTRSTNSATEILAERRGAIADVACGLVSLTGPGRVADQCLRYVRML